MLPPQPPPRASGFDVLPPQLPPGVAADAQKSALEVAMRMADALSAAAPMHPQQLQAQQPKTLDELLARDRARIAAADQRNLTYVADQASAAKARAKAAASAAKAALSASSAVAGSSAGGAAGGAAQDDSGAPPAKAPRLEGGRPAGRSAAGGAAACSVYVAGLPLDVESSELQAHMERVGPVVRVKVYLDRDERAKGDALVTYQKDAAVLGAIQLLNGSALRPGWPLDVSRPVWGAADGAPASIAAGAGPSATSWATERCETNGGSSKGRIAAAPRLIPSLVKIPGLDDAVRSFDDSGPKRGAPGRGESRGEPRAAAGAPSAAEAGAPSHLGGGAAASAAAASSAAGAMANEETLRVVVVRRFFLPSEVPPAGDVAARRAWVATVVDDLWEEACKYGEVERIEPLLDGDALSSREGTAAIRFQSVISAGETRALLRCPSMTFHDLP